MPAEPTDSSTDFKTKLNRLQSAVEIALRRFTPAPDTRPKRLHEAMRYSLEAGGKRLRPVLLLASAEIFGCSRDALPAAVAVECLHTYSLIHDDLPGIDNSELRRGRPTCHRQFDEATAILAGDALLTHAFFLLADAYADAPVVANALVRELGDAAGSRRLIGGQMEDILAERESAGPDELEFIHRNKTGALIIVPLVMGALLAGAAENDIATARATGHHLGLAFQIVDDILDATSTAEELGKPVGSDAAASKTTYVSLYGLASAREQAQQHTAAALDACANLPGDSRFLAELISQLVHRLN